MHCTLFDPWQISPALCSDDTYFSHPNFMSVILPGCQRNSAHNFEVLAPCYLLTFYVHLQHNLHHICAFQDLTYGHDK